MGFLTHHRQDLSNFEQVREPANFALLLYRFLDDNVADQCARGNNTMSSGPVQSLLAAIQKRQAKTVAALAPLGYKFQLIDAYVDWRMVIGGSYGKLWDTGFQVHPLYGVPFLPASAIKGALLHYWRESNLGDSASLFGAEDHRGDVIFFEAFCRARENGLPQAYFDYDVINVHYRDYYQQAEAAVPADYCDPVPINFLTIAEGVRFVFRLAAKSETLCNDARKHLKTCLEEYGIGAKTRVNYGRLRE